MSRLVFAMRWAKVLPLWVVGRMNFLCPGSSGGVGCGDPGGFVPMDKEVDQRESGRLASDMLAKEKQREKRASDQHLNRSLCVCASKYFHLIKPSAEKSGSVACLVEIERQAIVVGNYLSTSDIGH